jgi:hypothetical protein
MAQATQKKAPSKALPQAPQVDLSALPDRQFNELLAGIDTKTEQPANTVTLSVGLAQELDKLAEAQGVDRDYLVERLLHRALDTAPATTLTSPGTSAPGLGQPPTRPTAPPAAPLPGETDGQGVTWGVRVEGGDD